MVALGLAVMQSMRKSLYLHFVYAKPNMCCTHIQAVLEDSFCHVLRIDVLAVQAATLQPHMLLAFCFAGH